MASYKRRNKRKSKKVKKGKKGGFQYLPISHTQLTSRRRTQPRRRKRVRRRRPGNTQKK